MPVSTMPSPRLKDDLDTDDEFEPVNTDRDLNGGLEALRSKRETILITITMTTPGRLRARPIQVRINENVEDAKVMLLSRTLLSSNTRHWQMAMHSDLLISSPGLEAAPSWAHSAGKTRKLPRDSTIVLVTAGRQLKGMPAYYWMGAVSQ